MRHSRIELTMGVYTDPMLLDIRGALDALPALPLTGSSGSGREAARATDSDDHLARMVAPTVAPTLDNSSTELSFAVKTVGDRNAREEVLALDVTSGTVKTKQPLTIPVSGCSEVGATGLEPVTPSVSKCVDTLSFFAGFLVNSRILR